MPNNIPSVSSIISQMYDNDAFSQWLGIERLEERRGYCKLRMRIRPEMTNGFNIAHGGISYALADSAFAFASNSFGRKSVSVETSISHTKPIHTDDIITAEASVEHLGNKIGIFRVIITNQEQVTVALFKGTVYRTSREWFAGKKNV